MNVHDRATRHAAQDRADGLGTHALTSDEVLASMLESAGDDEALQRAVREAHARIRARRPQSWEEANSGSEDWISES